MFEFNRSPLPVLAGLCVALLGSVNHIEWPDFASPSEVSTMTRLRSMDISLSLVKHRFAATHDSPRPAPPTTEQRLLVLDQRYIELRTGNSPDALANLIGDDFLLTDREGNWVDRAALLDRSNRAAGLRAVESTDVRARVVGQAGLVHGVMLETARDGATARVRYTNVYARTNDGWRLVNSHHTALKSNVDVSLKVGAFAAWRPLPRAAPLPDDTAELFKLNDGYVKAFRDANPAWYDAHLAPDYLVINSDGALNDRNTALARFAKPTFATHFKTFPVNKVRIRRFGDVALIHAENAYELKDGRKGVDRYTDIWLKRNDHWFCVAAHITTHRAAT
jgi:ketosteroid isomerase-like protein